MSKVTKESLDERIEQLEDLGSMISLNEEYQLSAYRKLLHFIEGYESLPYVILAFEDEDE